MLAVGADGGCLDIFLSSIISPFFLPLSLGNRLIKTEILLKEQLIPKQPKKQLIKGIDYTEI